MNDLHFPRPELAARIADDLVGASLLSDARNGLFLAQARRTGKSWFLQRDLKPALEAKGWIVLYVDLWTDIKRDPASLISDVIETAFEEHLGWATKASKRMGIEKLGLGGASVNLAQTLDFAALTLADALNELHQRSKKKIALLIDEAQHALTSEAGEAAMIALKSARDQMNAGNVPSLLLEFYRAPGSPGAPRKQHAVPPQKVSSEIPGQADSRSHRSNACGLQSSAQPDTTRQISRPQSR